MLVRLAGLSGNRFQTSPLAAAMPSVIRQIPTAAFDSKRKKTHKKVLV